MIRVDYSRFAVAQLEALYTYIAENAGADTAARFVMLIMDYCDGFATFPLRGIRRDDIRPGLRLAGFHRLATIAFTVEDEVVTILGVFYGGQNVEAHLQTNAKYRTC